MIDFGLSNMYKRAGIAYRFSRPQARKYLDPGTANLTPNQKQIRAEAARDLMNILASGDPCVFIDECSIKSQQPKLRTWM